MRSEAGRQHFDGVMSAKDAAYLFSLYSFAASELAGEFGLGSHKSDCKHQNAV